MGPLSISSLDSIIGLEVFRFLGNSFLHVGRPVSPPPSLPDTWDVSLLLIYSPYIEYQD
jgi:hypothetical protein